MEWTRKELSRKMTRQEPSRSKGLVRIFSQAAKQFFRGPGAWECEGNNLAHQGIAMNQFDEEK